MPASARSRVFFFRLVPGAGDGKPEQAIAINEFAPVEIENDHFQGHIMLIHETGNEPEFLEDEQLPESMEQEEVEAEGEERSLRGVELQIQGRFKEPCSLEAKIGLWVSAEIEAPLKLGWFMKNIAMLFVKFAQQKSGGRLNYSLGSATEHPKIGFPVATVFKCCITPPGASAPRLGSQELSQALKYMSSSDGANISPENTVTFACATKFLDLCSWEVLNVPAASPLALERLIGDVTVLHLSFYSLDSTRTHAAGRQRALLNFVVRRANEHEHAWEENVMPGARTPLDDVSDLSEVSDLDDLQDQVDEDQPSEDSDSDEDSVEDSDAISRADSLVLSELETWKPSVEVGVQIENGISVHAPFYIEAIDRRHSKKLHVWFLFTVPADVAEREWWHAMAVPQLAPCCKRRPRTIRTFPGTQAAAVKRYGAQSLEQFRLVIQGQLHEAGSRLRDTIMTAAKLGYLDTDTSPQEQNSPRDPNPGGGLQKVFGKSKSLSGALCLAQQMASFDLPIRRKKRTRVAIPPRFFVDSGSKAVELAFASAKEGRGNVAREGLVGAIHFEGRVSEEMMRISLDGCVRLFAPFQCDKPRVRLLKHQLLSIRPVEGLYLGRFSLFEVHTELRVFSFCCQDVADRDSWVEALDLATKAASWAGNNTFGTQDLNRDDTRDPKMQLLSDTTLVKRWRSKHRLVLNDRRVLAPHCVQPANASVASALLEKAFAMPEQPTSEDLIGFMDATCILKAVQFKGWTQEEYTAFWLNVYHCLILHGRTVLGIPRTRRQQSRFHSRVSYLVATVPMSLREIETYILRVPKSDVLAANAVYSRARAGQDKVLNAMTFVSWPRVALWNMLRWPFASTSGHELEEQEGESDREHDLPDETMISKIIQIMPLVGKVPLPQARRKPRLHPCLFLGYPVEIPSRERMPHRDLRFALVLNRGNQASLGTVPIFAAENLDSQLDDISRAVVAEFVKMKQSVMGSKVLVLPRRLRGLWRELRRDSLTVARFIWNYMPPDGGEMPQKIQLSFRSIPTTPRGCGKLRRHSYSEKSLEVLPEAFSQLQSDFYLAESGKYEAWRPWVVKL